MEADTAERSRKFAMLQRTFKTNEEALRQQVEEAQAAVAAANAAAGTAAAEAAAAQATSAVAVKERESLLEELRSVREAVADLHLQLEQQMAAGAAEAGRAAALEAELQVRHLEVGNGQTLQARPSRPIPALLT